MLKCLALENSTNLLHQQDHTNFDDNFADFTERDAARYTQNVKTSRPLVHRGHS